MKLSFLIINKDDRGIERTLAALGDEHEVVVVDASEGRLDDVRDRFPRARWIPFVPTGKPTIPEQRNVSVRESTGDVMVFIDASCEPDAGWLAALVRPIAHDGEQIVAGAHRSSGDAGLRDEAGRFLAGARYLREAPTINLAVRREVFDRVGGFDEAFHYGSDVDFTWRCVDAGLRIRYAPDAVIAHDWGQTREEVRRSYLYGQARARLYAKHPHRLREAPRHDPTAVAYPLFLLLAPAALRRPSLLALLAIPFIKNARHRPLLTTAHGLVYGAGVMRGAVASP
jgi:hypothetical protein